MNLPAPSVSHPRREARGSIQTDRPEAGSARRRPRFFRWSAAAIVGGALGWSTSCTNGPQPGRVADTVAPAPLTYAVGADLSFLAAAESHGVRFKDGGVVKPGVQIFRDHGYGWIRLRVFHTPTQLPNSLPYTVELAQKAKALGYRFLLDLHYSDTWADPAKQTMPAAWVGKSHAELVTAVRDYTREVVAALRAAGAMPDMVQVGNEITPGMLWPDGRLPEHWDNFAELVRAGIDGVRLASIGGARPLIMIHIEKPGNIPATRTFFDHLLARGVTFDVIGQSYYPWWHGSLLELRDGLAFMAARYHKDIVVVETAYNWRPAEYRDVPAPFPETPEGQREFLDELNRVVLATPDGLGKGVFWWEPAVEAGAIRSRGMFDEQNNALPVVSVFDKFTRGKVPEKK